MGSASVYQDGVKVATINKDLITYEDRRSLKLASKSYMQPLFLSDVLTKTSNFKITVDSGEIWLTGIVTAGDGTVELNPPHAGGGDSDKPIGDTGSGNENDESNKIWVNFDWWNCWHRHWSGSCCSCRSCGWFHYQA